MVEVVHGRGCVVNSTAAEPRTAAQASFGPPFPFCRNPICHPSVETGVGLRNSGAVFSLPSPRRVLSPERIDDCQPRCHRPIQSRTAIPRQ